MSFEEACERELRRGRTILLGAKTPDDAEEGADLVPIIDLQDPEKGLGHCVQAQFKAGHLEAALASCSFGIDHPPKPSSLYWNSEHTGLVVLTDEQAATAQAEPYTATGSASGPRFFGPDVDGWFSSNQLVGPVVEGIKVKPRSG